MRGRIAAAPVAVAVALGAGGDAAARDTSPPAPPARVVVSARTTDSLTVSWQAAADDVGIAGYVVFRSGRRAGVTRARRFTLAGLPCGRRLPLAVAARDTAGNTSRRTAVAGRTLGCPTVAVAGDIAGVGTRADATARVVSSLAPAAVLTTGDNVYPDGAAAEYTASFDPTWGAFKPLLRPVPGNHDYRTRGASGYFGYFGEAAGPAARGYYAFDVGSWHLVALNSEIAHDAASAQVRWLRAELARTSASCVLAYWHRPRFSSGVYSDDAGYAAFWEALEAARADVVVTGHDHNYQRFVPLAPDGRPDPDGLRQFVVGTGGAGLYPLRPDARRAAGIDTAHGVLALTLRTRGYGWRFVPASGSASSDRGSASCR